MCENMTTTYVNSSGYKFVPLESLAARKAAWLPVCKQLGLKGSILLSDEGVNMFLAGTRESIDAFLETVRSEPEFADFQVKESLSDHQPFSRMLIRLKKEIISMGVPSIEPRVKTSPKLTAKELKQWLDEGRDVTLLDVRNDYEVDLGTFENAVPIGVDHFRKFPDAVKQLPDDLKSKPVVMFCTGGIRCEKAGPLMEREGFENIFQLDGGILKYFEECGGQHYDGDCFVFDKRVAVDSALAETGAQQCYNCQAIVSIEDQGSPHYSPPHVCPFCFQTPEQKMQQRLQFLNQQIVRVTTPLPGSVPYDNIRPLNVPKRFDQAETVEFLLGMHSHLGREYWQQECELERITYKGQPLAADTPVRSGWRVEHHIPQTVEADVSNAIVFLHDDDDIVVVSKPAPLPMHPCGRFNRNTLGPMVQLVYPGEQIRMAHRLDANTTGIVVLCRKRSAANALQKQFRDGTVEKTYLAQVHGHPEVDEFECDLPISSAPAGLAGVRVIDCDGLPSVTTFKVLRRDADGTSLIECHPRTGRTNQIRLHLSQLGFPIVGDPTYSNQSEAVTGGTDSTLTQTKSVGASAMCLHALRLTIQHPTSGQSLTFEASAPWR